jgi:hypothetical protein
MTVIVRDLRTADPSDTGAFADVRGRALPFNADVDKLLADAETQVNQILASVR